MCMEYWIVQHMQTFNSWFVVHLRTKDFNASAEWKANSEAHMIAHSTK